MFLSGSKFYVVITAFVGIIVVELTLVLVGLVGTYLRGSCCFGVGGCLVFCFV